MIIIVVVILITITIIISAVMDWELVCERKELRATAQAIFMTGVNNFNFLIIIIIIIMVLMITGIVTIISIIRPLPAFGWPVLGITIITILIILSSKPGSQTQHHHHYYLESLFSMLMSTSRTSQMPSSR